MLADAHISSLGYLWTNTPIIIFGDSPLPSLPPMEAIIPICPSLLNSDSRFHRVYFRPEKNRIFQRHLTDVCQGNQLLYLVTVHRDSTNITISLEVLLCY